MTVKPTDPYVWTKERCVNALLTFHAENGRTPYWDEFEKAPRWRYPHPNTIRNMFGSWGAAIRELGLPTAPYRSRWNKDRIVDAMLDHVLVAGRWPTCEDWTKPLDGGNDRPAKRTVLYHFGTWNEAKRCAGWDGRHPRARVEEYVEPRCEECGTEFENTVIGCKSCHERHRGRRRRLEVKAETAAVSTGSKATVSDQRRVAA